MIAGATATGKTRLSLELAEAIAGQGRPVEIVSADSRQVYRGMDVGTAKVDRADRARVPHHGLDLVEPDEPFSVAAFRTHALDALRGIAGRSWVALLVGGTGLYLRVVARGVALESDTSDPSLRADLEQELVQRRLPALAEELRRLAPTLAARTDLANPRRVVRALERARLAGDRPPPARAGYPAPVLWLGLRAESRLHRTWIADRAAWQFANGLPEEAADLRRLYPADLPAFSAFGYREAFALLDGELTFVDAVARTIDRTTAYARRQRTWFRAEPGIAWLEANQDTAAEAVTRVQRFLEAAERAVG